MARFLQRRVLPRPGFQDPKFWTPGVAPLFDRAWTSAWNAQMRSFRTIERKGKNRQYYSITDRMTTSFIRPNATPLFDLRFNPAMRELTLSERTRQQGKRVPGRELRRQYYSTNDFEQTAYIRPNATPLFDARFNWALRELALSERARAKKNIWRRFPNTFDVDWIAANFAPAFDAATWPSIEELLDSGRRTEWFRKDRPYLSNQLWQPTWVVPALSAVAQFGTAVSGSGLATIVFQRPGHFDIGWIASVLPQPFDPATMPGIEQLADSRLVAARRQVFNRTFSQDIWTLGATAQLWPGVGQLIGSRGAWLRGDRRIREFIQDAWIYRSIPDFDPAIFPGIEYLTDSRLTDRRVDRMLRNTLQEAWLYTGSAFTANLWPGIGYLLGSRRSDPRLFRLDRDFVQSVLPTFDVSTFPSIEMLLDSARTGPRGGRSRGDIFDAAWIYPNLPQPFDPATWPGIAQLPFSSRMPYRTLRPPQGTPADLSWAIPTGLIIVGTPGVPVVLFGGDGRPVSLFADGSEGVVLFGEDGRPVALLSDGGEVVVMFGGDGRIVTLRKR